MNANVATQIATFLNTSPNAIKRCEEWANCYFVIVHGRRPRFVSKKIIKGEIEMLTIDQCREAYARAVAADVFDGDVDTAKRLWLGDQSTFERQNRKGLIEANLSSLAEKKVAVLEDDDSRLFQTLSYIVAGL